MPARSATSHGLPLEDPEVVIDAIRAVCHAARTGLPLRDAARQAIDTDESEVPASD